jgi:hypothetical protein
VDPDPAELIVRGEDHLSAAVQIIDSLLQPALEMLLTPICDTSTTRQADGDDDGDG